MLKVDSIPTLDNTLPPPAVLRPKSRAPSTRMHVNVDVDVHLTMYDIALLLAFALPRAVAQTITHEHGYL